MITQVHSETLSKESKFKSQLGLDGGKAITWISQHVQTGFGEIFKFLAYNLKNMMEIKMVEGKRY